MVRKFPHVVVSLVLLVLLAACASTSTSVERQAKTTDISRPRTILPPDVPNIADRAVREDYRPIAVKSPLKNDHDFPAVLLSNVRSEEPFGLVLILDARNGKDTWSLPQDPIIFIVLTNRTGEATLAYMDEGFEVTGKASGTFTRAEPGQVKDLYRRLLRAYEKVRAAPTAGPLQPA